MKVGESIASSAMSGVIGALGNLAVEVVKTFATAVKELAVMAGSAAATAFAEGLRTEFYGISMPPNGGQLQTPKGWSIGKEQVDMLKKMDDQTKVLKDIYKQGNVAILE